jgi:tetratricopeptide (TPR) repeat protein
MLHSYRDGRGKVCQRRLGHFCDAAGLDRQLAELPGRCPEFAGEVDKLRARGQALLSDGWAGGQPRVERMRAAIRSLLRGLAEEKDPEVMGLLAAELEPLRARLEGRGPNEFDRPLAEAEEQIHTGDLEGAERNLGELVRATRGLLPPGRQCFDPSELQVWPHLQALELLGHVLTRQDRLPEAARVMAERVRRCPTAPARLRYGSLLQKLGRPAEALQQYQCLPDAEADGHYHLASLRWQQGLPEEALVHLLRGLLRDPYPMEALARMEGGKSVWRGDRYWNQYGDLWTAPARRFAVFICRQHLVRRKLRLARERGVKVRSLVAPSSRVWLVQRGLQAANRG